MTAFLIKITILFLIGLLIWLVFRGKAFAILSVAAAIFCLAKSCQVLTPPRKTIPEDKP